MNNEAGAQPCGVDVGAAAEITRPEVCVHVLVVSLEEANRQVMIEERHLIVHAAAHREIVTPLVGIEIRAVYLRRSYQPMDKRCNVSARETRDQTAGNRKEAVVVPMRTDVGAVAPLGSGVATVPRGAR